MRYAAIWPFMLLLAACSGPPPVSMAPPGQDAAGKQFNPPPAGMAAVYVYNPTNNGPAINATVGPMVVGSLAPTSWMRVELAPGWHAVSCTTANSVNPSSITVAPGQMRFIDIEMPPGSAVCLIREASPDAGRAGVLACWPASGPCRFNESRHPERSRPKGGVVEGPALVDAPTEQVPPLRLA